MLYMFQIKMDLKIILFCCESFEKQKRDVVFQKKTKKILAFIFLKNTKIKILNF